MNTTTEYSPMTPAEVDHWNTQRAALAALKADGRSCWCGLGCNGTASLTDDRIRSERDAEAKYAAMNPGATVEALPVIEKKGSGVTVAEDPAMAARKAEAMAYARDYTGSWGLILDLRADPKWGTKWMKFSPRLVDILLAAKERDAARAAEAATAPAREREAEVARWIEDEMPRNEFAASLYVASEKYGRLTDKQHEAVLRLIDREPKAADGTAAPAAAEGWYKVDGTIFKVQKAVNGSGHLYAKRLEIHDGHPEWVYAAGAIKTLAGAQRLTVEEAAEFGHLYGVCAVCGRTLTDEKSIDRGIGPVCIKRLA